MKLFVRAPRCPRDGTKLIELYSGVRGAWNLGMGRFNCRLCRYEAVYAVRNDQWTVKEVSP